MLLLILFGMMAVLTIPMYLYKKEPIRKTQNNSLYAKVYDSIYFNPEKFDREMKVLTPTESSYVLDVGCGTGDRVGAVYNTVGVDNSTSMLAVARQKYPDKEFVEGDVMKTNTFAKDTFTTVWCLGNTIYSLPNKFPFFQNVYRWLESNGTFVVQLDGKTCEPSIYPKLFEYKLQRIGNTCRERIRGNREATTVHTTFYPIPLTRLLELAKQAGFVLLRTENNDMYFFRKSLF